MNKNIIKEEYINLGGKRIKLVTIKSKYASAFNKLCTIEISDKLKKILSKDELNAALLHEKAHCLHIITLIVSIITLFVLTISKIIPVSIFIDYVSYLPLICLIILLLYMQIIEILADRYSIKRTKKGVFKTALSKVYKYNDPLYVSCLERIEHQIRLHLFHPTPKLRFCLIDCMDDYKCKEESLK